MRQSLFEVRGESIEEGIAYLLVPIAPLSIVSLDNGDLNDIVPLGEAGRRKGVRQPLQWQSYSLSSF